MKTRQPIEELNYHQVQTVVQEYYDLVATLDRTPEQDLEREELKAYLGYELVPGNTPDEKAYWKERQAEVAHLLQPGGMKIEGLTDETRDIVKNIVKDIFNFD